MSNAEFVFSISVHVVSDEAHCFAVRLRDLLLLVELNVLYDILQLRRRSSM